MRSLVSRHERRVAGWRPPTATTRRCPETPAAIQARSDWKVGERRQRITVPKIPISPGPWLTSPITWTSTTIPRNAGADKVGEDGQSPEQTRPITHQSSVGRPICPRESGMDGRGIPTSEVFMAGDQANVRRKLSQAPTHAESV
jgi:hypothetical protein